MRTLAAGIIVAITLVLAAAPMTAHHSFDGEYDRNKTISLTGKVVNVEWVNPHVTVTVLVTNSDGTTSAWEGEGKPPHVMIRNGWKRSLAVSMVKSGEVVTMKGYAGKNRPGQFYAINLTRADGKTVLELSGEPKQMASR